MGNCSGQPLFHDYTGLILNTGDHGKVSSPEVPLLPPSNIGLLQQGLPPRIKVVVLGDAGVGKSCLALRFSRGTFDPCSRATVGASFLTKSVTLPDGRSTKLEVWDTAGQERYHSLAPLYYRGAQGAVIVYDITSPTSFERAKFWVEELRRGGIDSAVLVLVGNKKDLWEGREVSEEAGQEYADRNRMIFVECSAKTSDNVTEVFESLARAWAGGLPVSSSAINE
ncbi:hypothetical protein CEUSTIGMA_g2753.t1 [Chlamydomonas eustigma]|uniref:Uncharacterized protein n=1 Tax=Chlamydomonas eustigma TaxID=1157962 RepID=A0A250WWT9_9CHLO|nr:hypothetical protein CEUSTIGMA_g2753.t1 [Chlamydomonas eustigma]|eukprot:GAX75308.1 hypothetical protein CEUSTIGMA_g2753.t1 [Chlamydomonas eustigma]